LFLLLLIVGLIIIFYFGEVDNFQDEIGNLLFNGGISPLILASWAVFTGPSSFRRLHAIRTITAGLLFSIGLVILLITQQISIVVFGTSIFEMGALFFIQKFFFVAEGEEYKIDRLEKELEEAKRSPGMGMALSYFYNFIIPTASNLRNEGDDVEHTPIDMEIKRGEMAEYSLDRSHLLVFVPRNLDGSDMKVFLRNISQDRKVLQGKPKERPGNATHRPMFVYFLDWNEEKKTCNGLFDIPTIISSVWDRAQDEIKHHKKKRKKKQLLKWKKKSLISKINFIN